MRPRQWVKNLLVLAAPAAAGSVTDPEVLLPTALAFVSFCAASSAVYLVNDVADLASDRAHPTKRHRPIAAGDVSVRTALVAAVALSAIALLLAWVADESLALLILGYLVLQLLYSWRLKHEPVLDLALVSAGFLMRAVAGGLAAGLPLSQWFLLVSGFGSLFIVAGKRYSELQTLGVGTATRRSLTFYTETYLRFVWSVAAAATMLAYSLWAFEQQSTTGTPWHTLSIAPFVLVMLRYSVDVDAGEAAEPEDIVFGDRVLQLLALIWLVLTLVGVVRG
jgi:decaprenyl-phosphate phosphoribosyltransferase